MMVGPHPIPLGSTMWTVVEMGVVGGACVDVDVDEEQPPSSPRSVGGDDTPTPPLKRLSRPVNKLDFAPGDFFPVDASKERERWC